MTAIQTCFPWLDDYQPSLFEPLEPPPPSGDRLSPPDSTEESFIKIISVERVKK